MRREFPKHIAFHSLKLGACLRGRVARQFYDIRRLGSTEVSSGIEWPAPLQLQPAIRSLEKGTLYGFDRA